MHHTHIHTSTALIRVIIFASSHILFENFSGGRRRRSAAPFGPRKIYEEQPPEARTLSFRVCVCLTWTDISCVFQSGLRLFITTSLLCTYRMITARFIGGHVRRQNNSKGITKKKRVDSLMHQDERDGNSTGGAMSAPWVSKPTFLSERGNGQRTPASVSGQTPIYFEPRGGGGKSKTKT